MEQLKTYNKPGGAILVGGDCVWLQENIAPGVREVFWAICARATFPQTHNFCSKLNIKHEAILQHPREMSAKRRGGN